MRNRPKKSERIPTSQNGKRSCEIDRKSLGKSRLRKKFKKIILPRISCKNLDFVILNGASKLPRNRAKNPDFAIRFLSRQGPKSYRNLCIAYKQAVTEARDLGFSGINYLRKQFQGAGFKRLISFKAFRDGVCSLVFLCEGLNCVTLVKLKI